MCHRILSWPLRCVSHKFHGFMVTRVNWKTQPIDILRVDDNAYVIWCNAQHSRKAMVCQMSQQWTVIKMRSIFIFFLFGSDREVDGYPLSMRYYGLERGPIARNVVCSKMTYLIFWRHSFMLIKMKPSVPFHCHWNARRMQFESRIINAPAVFI